MTLTYSALARHLARQPSLAGLTGMGVQGEEGGDDLVQILEKISREQVGVVF